MSIAIAIAMGLLPIGAPSSAPDLTAEGAAVAEVSEVATSEARVQYEPIFGTGGAATDPAASEEPVADVVGAGRLAKVSCIGCTAGILLTASGSLFGLLFIGTLGSFVPACVLACKQAFY